MSFKIRAAALVMAAVTVGSSLSAFPVSAAGQSASYSTSSSKAPTAKTTYSSTDKSITISWDKVSGANGYYIYRWSSFAPAWIKVGIANSVATNYTDKKVTAGTSYKYYIVAYKSYSGKRIMSGRSSEISACTKPSAPKITNTFADTSSLTFSWIKIKCSGYEVSYKKSGGSWSSSKKINSANTTSYDITGLKAETSYTVRVRAFVKSADGTLVYSSYSTADISTESDFPYRKSSKYLIERLDSAKRTSAKNTYYECNRQDSKETKTLITISDEDMATIKRFVDAHYKSDMSVGEFLDYTVQWLNKNISYADGYHGPAYSEIWNRSHVDNCFNYKVGQCIQYNSTICAVMRYLGYDARVIQGWRGTSLDNKWQHFWCEVTINGTDYVMDSYNYGTDGDWYFVCATYEETAPYSYNSHYIMNKKLMAPFTGYSNIRNRLAAIKTK
ncbi:fibronectin type III domain-containing protein [Ruminococcus albus]|uniref:Transglutaminase-like superfamily protein n=1 Tax=Ruminococcus albus TaxID=1264 RepID=A0A1H7IX89_RUMAL|nr:fibronectin type III domain-containing protein [Ruminococcus albus]SEK65425.1 Transglutaminase-like superfamily protein [Ruminococcus albus]